MKLISFDPLRTLGFPPHQTLKPEQVFHYRQAIQEANWVLFPPYWLVNGLVYGLHARIFPSLPSYLIGHNKIEMTRAFELIAPANVPWTLIRANTPSNAEEIWDTMTLPFVAKIPKSSMGNGVFLIEERQQWLDYCQQTDVLYAQEHLPIDRDLRIVVIGDEVVGGYWRVQSPYSFHNNIAQGGEVVAGLIPESATQLVLHLARTLGVDHAGFDIAMVGNHPYVLEFNRIFGTQGINALMGDLSGKILNYLRRLDDEDDPIKPRGPEVQGGGVGKTRRRRAA